MNVDDKPKTDPMLQFFEYAHLRPELQVVSKPFGDLARLIVEGLPPQPRAHGGAAEAARSEGLRGACDHLEGGVI